ncbi:tyrosine-type recombinase/integrase [Alicyclobacillus dauci]|uniref:Tyrosine-type recombinase/integrase n=1 Tax=Alicyclobacillus dauci TaxID=1475485 RepID=A0ABY6Z159_9BACL|nr:tyrosine-type recombinase/integrase [Alicyclobacillus dauci]WAH36459.1 tyrosine-type recombinase/integrase [Alicyclobacillus dauci]
MTHRLKQEFAEYRLHVEQRFGYLPEHVLVDNHGKGKTPNAIKNVFKRLKNIMNFTDVRLSSHTFRHTFAHRCLMAGMDVFTLKDYYVTLI